MGSQMNLYQFIPLFFHYRFHVLVSFCAFSDLLVLVLSSACARQKPELSFQFYHLSCERNQCTSSSFAHLFDFHCRKRRNEQAVFPVALWELCFHARRR